MNRLATALLPLAVMTASMVQAAPAQAARYETCLSDRQVVRQARIHDYKVQVRRVIITHDVCDSGTEISTRTTRWRTIYVITATLS